MVTQYRRGRDFEYKVVHHFKKMGWPLVVRSAGSKGLIDVTVIGPMRTILLSCKRNGYWPKDEIRQLKKLHKALRYTRTGLVQANRTTIYKASAGDRGIPQLELVEA